MDPPRRVPPGKTKLARKPESPSAVLRPECRRKISSRRTLKDNRKEKEALPNSTQKSLPMGSGNQANEIK
jgi:hypothetical protein